MISIEEESIVSLFDENKLSDIIHTAYIKPTQTRSVHMNKLSLWPNCRTVRGSCRYGTIGACGEAYSMIDLFFPPTHPPTLQSRTVTVVGSPNLSVNVRLGTCCLNNHCVKYITIKIMCRSITTMF